MIRALVVAIPILLLAAHAAARDIDGKWAQSPNRDWFRSLTDQRGQSCCDGADGLRLEDPDWDFSGTSYRVKLNGAWIVVEPGQVVTQNNKVGYAVVWPIYNIDGKLQIRCFMPGASG